jgi:hypothetical protein
MKYRAVAGDKHLVGKTVGEALDALTAQLPEDETGTMVIVQNLRPDRFFTAEQQSRLGELMSRWREARARDQSLPVTDQAELDALVEAELRGSASRAAAMLQN